MIIAKAERSYQSPLSKGVSQSNPPRGRIFCKRGQLTPARRAYDQPQEYREKQEKDLDQDKRGCCPSPTFTTTAFHTTIETLKCLQFSLSTGGFAT